MKKLAFYIFIAMVSFTTLNAQWEPSNGPLGGMINALTFIGNNIFAGTGGSGIFMSTDYGNNWIVKDKGLKDSEPKSPAHIELLRLFVPLRRVGRESCRAHLG